MRIKSGWRVCGYLHVRTRSRLVFCGVHHERHHRRRASRREEMALSEGCDGALVLMLHWRPNSNHRDDPAAHLTHAPLLSALVDLPKGRPEGPTSRCARSATADDPSLHLTCALGPRSGSFVHSTSRRRALFSATTHRTDACDRGQAQVLRDPRSRSPFCPTQIAWTGIHPSASDVKRNGPTARKKKSEREKKKKKKEGLG
ncbi:uncharacterized protein J3D65DRAFT_628612 [Phyllosticta citribraziliensis]|uniref:Uncharacterized protein n=1 Tax=Phyllosticta citribraziliensis TaxID=989973 RepID=A0ABR1LPJ9_9PEZI